MTLLSMMSSADGMDMPKGTLEQDNVGLAFLILSYVTSRTPESGVTHAVL